MSNFRWIRVTTFTVLSCMLMACASTANYDYRKGHDFNAIRNIQVIPPAKPDTPDTRINSPLVVQRFTNGISNYLAARGFGVVSSSADALLRYQLSTRSGVESYGSGVSFGFSRFWRHTGVGVGYELPDYDVESYDEAILTIDIVDPASNSLLWRGSNSRRLYDGMTPEKLDETVVKLIDETLANYPPGRVKSDY